ncbi:T9SS type A sorting domain-containing protein [Hymenobacter lutimineralis]|uniref:T9SS type A sorting domain-containing protein n=1 Tax=Hymenobacter lutimineralis TaxID=2606448 RepID=A0A5D6UWF1_9BACT|nr:MULTISPECIES: T9SS type A sorting domain-containing protein [Hymenobacter]QIX63164.1 T9SS type A sorting domain-containing protein [Hymenobacter sp. BT18]TYZ07863.1 T9SS type A sorting domain-containing protein [Hymenobacter lutimineralis]
MRLFTIPAIVNQLGFLILLGITILTPYAGHAQTVEFGHAVSAGHTRNRGESWGGRLAVDTDGNIYVVGSFGGSLYFGDLELISYRNQTNMFVAKFDARGNYLWAKQVGGSSRPSVTAVDVDAQGNVYVAGSYGNEAVFGTIILPASSNQRANVFVAKLDTNGNWLWATQGGNNGEAYASALVVEETGSLLVAGGFSSTQATFGSSILTNASAVGGSTDIYVAQLDANNGQWLKAQSIGSPAIESIHFMDLDAAGNAYIGGTFQGASFQIGSTLLTNAAPNTNDVFVAKRTPMGSWSWAASAGGIDHESILGITVERSGQVYITGSLSSRVSMFGTTTLDNKGQENTIDTYVAALKEDGTWRWATQSGSDAHDFASGIVLTPNGDLVVAGGFFGPTMQIGSTTLKNSGSETTEDLYVARLSSAGQWLGAKSTGGEADEEVYRAVLMPDGGICLLGNYWGQAAFGTTTLAGGGLPNIFLAWLDDNQAVPAVASLAPNSGAPGQEVTLNGSGFVGVREVYFNGVPAAALRVQSSTQLLAKVPEGVISGPISVRTRVGTGESSSFFHAAVSTATASAAANSFTLYPNPATNWLTLSILPAGSRIQLHDALGRVVRATSLTAQKQVSVVGLTPGLYTLQATDAQGRRYTSRVQVQ